MNESSVLIQNVYFIFYSKKDSEINIYTNQNTENTLNEISVITLPSCEDSRKLPFTSVEACTTDELRVLFPVLDLTG